MKITELYRPKLGKNLEAPAFDYFKKSHKTSDYDYEKRQDLQQELRDKLKSLGWKHLNSGVYSSVFSNPTKSFVLKINKRPDPGYQRYVNIVKSHRNKHFPIISDIKKMEIAGNIYYVYLIEKLISIPAKMAFNYERWFDSIITKPGIPLEKLFWNNVPIIFKKQPGLLKALQIVEQSAISESIYLHSKNMMKRADGTIIITDPYV